MKRFATAADPKAKIPATAIQKKSKKYGDKVVNYRKGMSGKLIPTSLKGGKALPGSAAAAPAGPLKPGQPGYDPEAAMFGADKEAVDAASYSDYADKERVLGHSVATEATHNADLDTVFDQFKSNLMGQKQAYDSAQAAAIKNVTDTNTQALGAAGQAMGQAVGAQAGADKAIGTSYADELNKQAAGALQASQTLNAASVSGLQGAADAGSRDLERQGNLSELERVQQHNNSANRMTVLKDQATTMAGERAAGKRDIYKQITDARAASHQQEIENAQVQYGLSIKDKDSKRDYLAAVKTADTNYKIAQGRDKTAITVGAGNNAATTTAATTGADARVKSSIISAGATTDAAKIRASSAKAVAALKNGKPAADGSITWVDVDGNKVTLTSAQRKTWGQRRRTLISAHRDLRKTIAGGGKEKDAVKSIMKRYGIKENVARALLGPAQGKNTADPQALAAYFPGGIVPPGYLAKGGPGD